MGPPELYRSEAFAEDLPDGGYEPLALRPVQLPPLARSGRLRTALRAVLAWALGRGGAASRNTQPA